MLVISFGPTTDAIRPLVLPEIQLRNTEQLLRLLTYLVKKRGWVLCQFKRNNSDTTKFLQFRDGFAVESFMSRGQISY